MLTQVNQVLNARLRGREFWVRQVKRLIRKRVVNTFWEIISNLQARCKNNLKTQVSLPKFSIFNIVPHLSLSTHTRTHTQTQIYTHIHTHADMCVFVYFFDPCENRIHTSSFFLIHLYYHVYFLRIRIFCSLTTVEL